MIEVKNLSKKFKAPSEEKGIFGFKKKDFWAVKDLNFNIKEGSVASILGPNGCGKTTTLRMIAGMLTPSKGTAFIDSIDVRKDKQTVKSKIGYMTNNTSLYDRLSVVETIKFFAELNQIPEDIYMPRAEKLFHQLDMTKYLSKRIADLSTGMKQKTSIVRTLIHDPDLVVLDEPTTGVDVTGQSVIIDLIRTIKDSGKTLIFSTHQLNEVRDIADHIVVMKSGEKIFDGNNEAFQALDSNKNFTEIFMELVNE
ncbi:MAG: ABC transporter ATP-binding protein [Gammaproteobacteria bacterium]|jgi:sodium transport system ATP-binding protein|tara:strand:+ start:305 stop:1063 length:759 start_codon:yes stop_codon:yes gene_type:complete